METNAYNGTTGCKVPKNICEGNFFYQMVLRAFRQHIEVKKPH